MATESASPAVAPSTSKVQATGTASVSGTKPGNMTLGDLTSMLSKPRKAAGETSSTPVGTQSETGAAPSSEHTETPGKRTTKAKKTEARIQTSGAGPSEGKTQQAAEASATELGGEPETQTETQHQGSEGNEGVETTDATENTDETGEQNELGAETTEAAEGGEPLALPDELQAMIDELKAGGRNTEGKMLKRIHKLADARDTERMGRLQAEQRAAQAEQQVQQLRTQKPVMGNPGAAADRFAAHPDVRTLDQQIASAQQVLEWCDANPDGAELDGQQFTPQKLRQFQRQAESNLAQWNGERAAKMTALKADSDAHRTQFNAQARKLYPWLMNRNSPDHVEALRLIEAMPALRELPGLEMIVGRYVSGLRAEQNRGKAAAKPPVKTVQRTPPPVATGPGEAAPREEKAGKSVNKAKETFQKTGKTSDLAKMFAEQQAERKAA